MADASELDAILAEDSDADEAGPGDPRHLEELLASPDEGEGALARSSETPATPASEAARIPNRVKALTSYTSVGNREISAPLHEIRAKFRAKTNAQANESSLGEEVQFAQVVGLDVLDSISAQLERNAQFQDHGPGLPTSIAVNTKFIVVGTSRSLVLVFNHAQVIAKVFCKGKPFDKLEPALRHAVTSDMDLGPASSVEIAFSGVTNNELALIGYARGRVELWDLARGSLLKSIPAGPTSHTCAISCVRFVGRGGSDSNRFDSSALVSKKPFATAITADTSGVVNMLVFSKTLMILSVEVKCLLDGAAGKIFAVSCNERLNMVALSSRKDTFLVSLDNATAKIVHRWRASDHEALLPSATTSAAPRGLAERASMAGCASPGPKVDQQLQGQQGQQSQALPRLSWGLARLGDDPNGKTGYVLARALGTRIEFLRTTAQRAGTGVEHSAEDATMTFKDSCSSGTDILAIEWLNVSLLAFVNTDYDLCILDVSGMAVLERTNVKNVELVWNSFSADAVSFQNSIRASGSTLYLLGICQLSVARVQTWTQRVETLIVHNGWLEALALALDHFQLTGHRERDKMADLIMRFATSTVGPTSAEDRAAAAACIEFCVEIQRTDLLFDTIYDIFGQSGKRGAFLRLMEPYILNRLLTTVRPSVLQDFVDEYVSSGLQAQLEQCILHLTPDTIRTDLHTLVSVCKEHALFAGLVYLYNAGLNDYEAPARLLLDLGQVDRLLSYVETSFRGLTYPFGFPMDDSVGLDFVRVGLLGFLIDNIKALAKSLLGQANDIGELIGLLELGLGQHEDDWELRAVHAIGTLDPSEAVRLCSRRLMLHPLRGLRESDKGLVDAVVQECIRAGDQRNLVVILRHCEPGLYDVGPLTEQIQAFGWQEALTTLHEHALDAATRDGQDLLRIRTVYEQIIRVSPRPAAFVESQLHRHARQIIVLQALKDAVHASLGELLRSGADDLEKLAASRVVGQLVADASALDAFPELQFIFIKSKFHWASAHERVDGEANVTFSWGGSQEDFQARRYERCAPIQPKPQAGSGEGSGASASLIDSAEPSDVERFIELLCKFDPHAVLGFVSANDGLFSLDAALDACRRHEIRNATAYLLERTGDTRGALQLILDSLLRGSALSFEHRRSLVQGAVQVCERNSMTDLDLANAESLWFQLLDATSAAVGVDESGGTESHGSALLRLVLDAMMSHVDSERIIFRVDSQTFGQLRHTIRCMIDARMYERRMLFTASKLATHDLVSLVRARHAQLARAQAVATTRALAHPAAGGARPRQTGRARPRLERGWEDKMRGLMPRALVIDP